MFRPLSAAMASNAMSRPEPVHRTVSPPSPPRDGGTLDREVTRVVASDRIPETPMAHQTSSASMPTSRGARQIGAPDVFDFVTAVLGADDAAAASLVQGLLADAVSVEAIYLDLLAPAARELGTRWEEDECSFVDVTVAMGRVHRVLRELSQAFQAEGPSSNQAGQILLTRSSSSARGSACTSGAPGPRPTCSTSSARNGLTWWASRRAVRADSPP
ncbi:MAG: B12-binding domain-containing protein [Gemmatimonadaceae bacterium]|nr:B12-binding domain-containing protein [Gemmatimonadaceae bacterium]